MGRRLNIALCIGMLDTEFSDAICEGALMAAKKIDANLFVLPAGIINVKNKPSEEELLRYLYQYNVLYSCPKSQSFDAVILEYGVITSLLEPEKKKEFLKEFGDIPILLMVGSEEGYHSITLDNKAGIKQAVHHLVNLHNCKKIGFVSGPKTNQDAIERLEAFQEAVHQYGLDESEKLIAYGDFTEFYPEITEELIKANPDIEAIVYANDQMAVSGYEALRNMNLEPGKDVLITGFDDSRFSIMMEPHFTSVRADTKEVAYQAVLACPDLVAGTYVDEQIASRLVVRESCGCNNENIAKRIAENMRKLPKDEFITYLAEELVEEYFNIFYDESERTGAINILKHYCEYYLGMLQPDGTLKIQEDEFEAEYRKYIQLHEKGYISLEVLFLIDQILYRYISNKVKGASQCLLLTEKTTIMRENFTSNVRTRNLLTSEQGKTYEKLLGNITRDMLQQQFHDESKRYETVILKLQRMGYASSYIYIYENGIVNTGQSNWNMPEKLYVKGYHNRDTVKLYSDYECEARFDEIFSDKYMPTDRRFDMLVLPLFSNEIQYGLLLIETELDSFGYVQQVASQVSVSMEAISIIKEQNEIKKELEASLAKSVETNKILDQMSRLDPMTGVTNRRGFFQTINSIINDKRYYGKKAIAVYADMDNLKIVNDEFGHDDGDFAIKTIARVLSESFRSSDVVGRMGGDEFAAFAIVNQENFSQKIRERIQTSLKEFNDQSDKPYYVNISIGIHEFVINESVNIEHVFSKADANLYIEKKEKKKRICIYKDR